MKAVVAVGNAFCAFSKELVDAFLASTAPAASTARDVAECGVGQTRSAASPGVPGCPCARAPRADLRPGEVVRAIPPVGSCAIERQYRGDGIARHVDEQPGRRRIVDGSVVCGN